MLLGKIVNLAVIAAGVVGVAKAGPEIIKGAMDAAKTIVTRSELSSMKKHMEMDNSFNNLGNYAGQPDAFAEYIRQDFKATFGRDPALDMWDRPYAFKHLKGKYYILQSLGPNGVPDQGCQKHVSTVSNGMEILAAATPGQAEIEVEKDDDDDICINLELERQSGAFR